MDVFDLYAKLSLDSSDYDRSLQQSSGSFEQFATKFTMVAKGIAGTLTNVVGKAVDQFASYEQLKGGVETLFGDYAGKVMENAKRAFETAGMSANEYMETVTSFSASLLQGLGGDTNKAADYADRALQDMSDNANKMGTNIASIQNAYQGFAKQNYTMLDNLKLGYGGTKEEMARLIKDASKLTAVQKKLGVTVDASSMSFDNIINAISVMQESMGIAGTTSEEAATTIEGSQRMMQASWENMLTSMVTGGRFFDQSMDALVSSVLTYAHNLLPAIEGALHGVSSLVSGLSDALGEELPGFLQEVLPDMISAVKSLLSGILTALPGVLTVLNGAIPMVIDALSDLIPDVAAFILEGVPTLAEAGVTLLTSLAEGISGNIETVVPQLTQGVIDMVDRLGEIAGENTAGLETAALTIMEGLAGALSTAVPSILTQITQLIQDLTASMGSAAEGQDFLSTATSILSGLVDSLMQSIPTILPELTSAAAEFISQFAEQAGSSAVDVTNTAISILKTLIDGLAPAIPSVMNDITTAALAIVDAILDAIMGLDVSTFLDAAVTLVTALADGLVQSVSTITDKLPELITGLVAWLTDPGNIVSIADAAVTIGATLVSKVPEIIESLVTGLAEIVRSIADYFSEHGDEMLDGLKEGFGNIGTKLGESWEETIKPAFETMWTDIKNYFLELEWVQTTSTFISGFVSGIQTKWTEVKKDALSFVNDIVDKVLALPDELIKAGEELIEGFVKGITETWDKLKSKVLNGVFGMVPDWAKELLKIQSPSKVFEDIGKNIDLGFVEGIEGYSHLIDDAISDNFSGMPEKVDVDGVSSTPAASRALYSGWTINVYPSEGMDERALAQLVANEVRDQVVSIGAAA